MPNVLAHLHATNEVFTQPPPNFLLGSVLPDFKGIYKDFGGGEIRLKGAGWESDTGIDFHYSTDSAFGQHQFLPRMTQPLAQDLETIDVPPRAARASAHLIVDVMVDRALLDYDPPIKVFRKLGKSVLYEVTQLDSGHYTEAFSDMIREYFDTERPRRYRDSNFLAVLAYRRLKARNDEQRKTFYEDQIPKVAKVFEAHAERVGALGVEALSHTIELLKI